MGRLCYPTQAPPQICPGRPESCHGARRVWRTFCRHGTNFIECWRDRGTSLIGAANLSPVTNLVVGTGAVSRYNLSRSQKLVRVQDFNCEQMRVSGCMNHYKFVLGAGAKAKSVTNNLPILSVLAVALIYLSIRQSPFINQIFLLLFSSFSLKSDDLHLSPRLKVLQRNGNIFQGSQDRHIHSIF